MEPTTTKTNGDRHLELREPTGHTDLDLDLRRADGFGTELCYTLAAAGETMNEEEIIYAHRLARRLLDQLGHLDEDIRQALEEEREEAIREQVRRTVGLED